MSKFKNKKLWDGGIGSLITGLDCQQILEHEKEIPTRIWRVTYGYIFKQS